MSVVSKVSRKRKEHEVYMDSYRTENHMEQKILLAELFLELKHKMLEIINFIPDPTFLINRKGKVIAWNQAMEELTNIKAKEILGKASYEVPLPFFKEEQHLLANLALSSRKISKPHYNSLKKEGDTLTAEIKLIKSNPHRRYLLLKAKPLYNLQGEIVGAIESIRISSIPGEI